MTPGDPSQGQDLFRKDFLTTCAGNTYFKDIGFKIKKKKIYIAILFRRVLKSISLAEVRILNLMGHKH